jgi:hypothetical protein
LACSICKIKKKYVFRTLDDTPIVTPANSDFGEKFVKAYKKVCKFLNVKLAPADPSREKAFENSRNGTVLGVQFNTKNMIHFIQKMQRNKKSYFSSPQFPDNSPKSTATINGQMGSNLSNVPVR